MEHEDFATYEQAQQLKELGFDWECQGAYLEASNEFKLYRTMTNKDWNEDVFDFSTLAPTMSQVQKWLREEKGIDVIVLRYDNDYDYKVYSKDMVSVTEELFDSYEKALSAGIDEALEIIKNK